MCPGCPGASYGPVGHCGPSTADRMKKTLRAAFPLIGGSIRKCPRQDSNLRTRLRRPMLYPLSYGGVSLR